jgi:hypothetical protein
MFSELRPNRILGSRAQQRLRNTEKSLEKVMGRKRHLLVDTQGLVLKAKVHAASVMDWNGIKTLLRQADLEFPRLSHLWLDSAYRGEDKGKDWVERGSRRASAKACPKGSAEVMGRAVEQRGRGNRLGETIAAARFPSAAS